MRTCAGEPPLNVRDCCVGGCAARAVEAVLCCTDGTFKFVSRRWYAVIACHQDLTVQASAKVRTQMHVHVHNATGSPFALSPCVTLRTCRRRRVSMDDDPQAAHGLSAEFHLGPAERAPDDVQRHLFAPQVSYCWRKLPGA